MYTCTNYQTKKALKEAVAEGKSVRCFQPSPWGEQPCTGTGTVYLEGPHYPQPHRWYAEAKVVDGKVVSVK